MIEGGFLIPKKGGDRVKVRVIKSFYDRSADMVLRKEGSEFEADGGRATELKNLGFVEPVPKPEKTKSNKGASDNSMPCLCAAADC